jgi:hypothetical protein
VNTRRPVETALEHMLAMLNLCKNDNLGIRDMVPALFLRLGRDQEWYDFCKWWATTGNKGCNLTTVPYLDIKNADVFEPVDVFITEYPELSHLLAIMLKIRLLIDLRALKRAKQEVLDGFRKTNVSSIVASDKDILGPDQGPRIKILNTQTKKLFEAVKNANKYFWPAMLDLKQVLTVIPASFSPGEPSEVQYVLPSCYYAWGETPGAFAIVQKLSVWMDD